MFPPHLFLQGEGMKEGKSVDLDDVDELTSSSKEEQDEEDCIKDTNEQDEESEQFTENIQDEEIVHNKAVD